MSDGSQELLEVALLLLELPQHLLVEALKLLEMGLLLLEVATSFGKCAKTVGSGPSPVGTASTSFGKSAKTVGSGPSSVGSPSTSFGKWEKLLEVGQHLLVNGKNYWWKPPK